MEPEKEICSIQELIQALEDDNPNYEGSRWYRGQAQSEWSLLPGYLRKEEVIPEASLVKRFKQSAALLLNSTPKDSFDWLFLMQHYGVPTRLLDWSESPLVALYFAIENHEKFPEKDAALWFLLPSELNKCAGIRDKDEEFFIPSFEDEELINYSIESLRQNSRTLMKPLATIATRNNARIQAQHGVFTIHHNEKIPIEDIEIKERAHVRKYIIPFDKKSAIAKQLALLGYTKFQLFPELASIGDTIKEKMQ